MLNFIVGWLTMVLELYLPISCRVVENSRFTEIYVSHQTLSMRFKFTINIRKGGIPVFEWYIGKHQEDSYVTLWDSKFEIKQTGINSWEFEQTKGCGLSYVDGILTKQNVRSIPEDLIPEKIDNLSDFFSNVYCREKKRREKTN